MRTLYLILLLLFATVVVVFAVQNRDPVVIKYLDRSASLPMPLLVAGVYVLGMFTGWSVVGFLRKSFQRATERLERTDVRG